MDDGVIPDFELRKVFETDIFFNAAEIHPPHSDAIPFKNLFYLTGDRETHAAQMIIRIMPTQRRKFEISGIVQGVGFRPFVYNLAREYALTGSVFNHSAGVTIEAEGDSESLDRFALDLVERRPPLAVIEDLSAQAIPCEGGSEFSITFSRSTQAESTPVPADIATCEDCLREFRDPGDRRFEYPFLNCTNCGPRFTVIRDLPYDRPATTMAGFPMCAACEAEYHDPGNRRFHAQPTACPACGPHVELEGLSGTPAIERARELLAAGALLAVKGIGGFHLACDATSNRALQLLRDRKNRFEQPFAVMARDLESVRRIAEFDDEEARLLISRERPIVLLRKRPGGDLSPLVAPGNGYLGVMLPYAPLHHLLVQDGPLVMTSANPSSQPIVRDNEEARERLASIADAFLTHNREIEVVCDDSVVRTFEGREMPLRRSRGYAPMPVRLPGHAPSLLAVGAELKSTFCITKGSFAYVSQHIGDMGTLETQKAFELALDHMLRLFRVTPERVVCDLHPSYSSSQWAVEYAGRHGLPLVRVQHHHAHVAALVAESGLPPNTPVIGVAFDGTGYGTDGAIWGGEILRVEGVRFDRIAHLKYVSLAGGDASVKSPARTALSHLRAAGIEWDARLPCVGAFNATELRVLDRQLERGLNCATSSSMGRLFDAVAAIIGVRQFVTYEGQAAIEMEAICSEAPPYDVEPFDSGPLLRAILADLHAGAARGQIAAAFHKTVAQWVLAVVRGQKEIRLVGLTGGVFQNIALLTETVRLLRGEGFDVLVHRKIPANDGGLSLGQAALQSGLPTQQQLI